MSQHIKFHFKTVAQEYILTESVNSTITPNPVCMKWPRSGYSREKALNRADRFVGEQVRRADAGTRFTYTQEIPKI